MLQAVFFDRQEKTLIVRLVLKRGEPDLNRRVLADTVFETVALDHSAIPASLKFNH